MKHYSDSLNLICTKVMDKDKNQENGKKNSLWIWENVLVRIQFKDLFLFLSITKYDLESTVRYLHVWHILLMVRRKYQNAEPPPAQHNLFHHIKLDGLPRPVAQDNMACKWVWLNQIIRISKDIEPKKKLTKME